MCGVYGGGSEMSSPIKGSVESVECVQVDGLVSCSGEGGSVMFVCCEVVLMALCRWL